MAFLCDSLSLSHGSTNEPGEGRAQLLYSWGSHCLTRHVCCCGTSVLLMEPPRPSAHVLLSIWGLLSLQLQCWSSCYGIFLPIKLTLQTVKHTDPSWLYWCVAFIATDIVLGSQRRPSSSLISLVHIGFPQCDTNVGKEEKSLQNWIELKGSSLNFLILNHWNVHKPCQ